MVPPGPTWAWGACTGVRVFWGCSCPTCARVGLENAHFLWFLLKNEPAVKNIDSAGGSSEPQAFWGMAQAAPEPPAKAQPSELLNYNPGGCFGEARVTLWGLAPSPSGVLPLGRVPRCWAKCEGSRAIDPQGAQGGSWCVYGVTAPLGQPQNPAPHSR